MSNSVQATLKDDMEISPWREYLSRFNLLMHPARKLFSAPELQAEPAAESPSLFKTRTKSQSKPNTPPVMPASQPDRHPYSEMTEPKKSVNFFASTLVIEGSVSADSDMVVEGTIRGNVTCRGNIEILGEIKGDVTGKTIRISQGKIKGNIKATEGLYIYNSTVTGDLFSQRAEIDSAVNGNITTTGTLTIKKASVIKGNITASALSIEENAMLEGQVVVSRNKPVAVPEMQTETQPVEKAKQA